MATPPTLTGAPGAPVSPAAWLLGSGTDARESDATGSDGAVIGCSPSKAERGLHHGLQRRVGAELAGDRAAAHHEHAMGEPEHLLDLRRDQQHGGALGSEP